MRILHICNDYCGSKVHSSLVRTLDGMGVRQTVYCPVRTAAKVGGNSFEGQDTRFVYSHIIKPWHHYTYYTKARTLYRDMTSKVEVGEFDVIHAATLFSDGILACRASRQHGVPYVVAVRGTDIEFLHRAPQAWPAGVRVMLGASRIVFITPALQKQFCESVVVRTLLPRIEHKFEIVPNGVDDYWLAHLVDGRMPVREWGGVI